MIKKIWSVVFLVFINQAVSAAPGRFFTIANNGAPVEANVTLCLNAKGPASCQDYNVSATDLTVLTTVPKHTYPFAGIKINSPYYSIGSGCTPLGNGFCMFSVSNTSAAMIQIKIPDYIIIGAGTAGAVLAKKLSDDMHTSVVALHNGPNLNQDPLINLSANGMITVLSGLIGPPLYALSDTIPQQFLNNRILNWIYALPLGGASSVNAGAWCRGTNQVYSQWEAIAGPLWSVSRILNTYIELEKYTGQTTNPAARGFNGPLPIRQEANSTQVSVKLTQAIMNATGVGFVLDYNDPNTPIGASTQLQYTQMGADGPLRASSAIAFLNNNVMDQNGNGMNGRQLRVLFNSTASNVIWSGNKAVGVRYYQRGQNNYHQGELKNLYASKGIIVSAGIRSSAFLMRSGVGPASLLQSLNIPVVFDNPNVGKGLADQPHVVLIYTSNPNDTPSSPVLQIPGNIISALANTPIGKELIKLIGFHVNVQNGIFSQIAWLPAPGGDPTVRKVRFASANPIPGIVVVLFDLVQPESRGSIVIKSSDPFVEPSMDLGVFEDPSDLTLYINAFQNYLTNINTELQTIDPTYQMVFPDPSVLNDPQSLTQFILEEVGTNMHFQSHCRMAPLNQGGVVDNTGHVYGVQNLLVADDSIVPVNMDGSPMATAYLIAANVANILQGK
ncbi:Alcohol dehydrogenase [acceptor] [Legionella steigerwaltii]|uniref:Alcohol dehydrogenase (Acceptor) n=1 Tax=Legionella steigerwaltii TaxID=460 RepID=A0A378L4J9_9GAMM|nr:GMC family oxidoreductase [Legionella steigerwaltii]KTD69951.1 Alcohol dehydrogenase (acceptor) [Legionella steigerwaltii]STY21736.1 Alcohol dehydrogenase [acceptor] [Legionella steigerwaltii]